MSVPKKKPTTSASDVSTSESSSPVLPDQEEFRHHLRRLAVSAVQVLIEAVHRSFMGRMHPQSPRLSQWSLHPRSRHSHRTH